MKKLLLLPLLIVASCNSPEIIADCNCDKVIEVQTFNVIGTPQNPTINYYSVYTTINECTQVQRSKTYNTTDPSLIPQLGQCR